MMTIEADVQFRTADPGDLADVHALIERAYRGDEARAGWTHEADLVEGPRTTRSALEAVLASPDERLLIATRAGRIVSCVQLSRSAGGRAYLGLLTVAPELQGSGIGKMMLARAEAEARQHFAAGFIELSVVSVRAELVAYYERRGFVRTGETRPFPVPLDPPLTLLVLERPLS